MEPLRAPSSRREAAHAKAARNGRDNRPGIAWFTSRRPKGYAYNVWHGDGIHANEQGCTDLANRGFAGGSEDSSPGPRASHGHTSAAWGEGEDVPRCARRVRHEGWHGAGDLRWQG